MHLCAAVFIEHVGVTKQNSFYSACYVRMHRATMFDVFIFTHLRDAENCATSMILWTVTQFYLTYLRRLTFWNMCEERRSGFIVFARES